MSTPFKPEWLQPGAVVPVDIPTLAAFAEELLGMQEKLAKYIEIHDAVVADADKAHALLRWAETEMRYAGWDTRLNDQHGRTDVYEAIKEFLA